MGRCGLSLSLGLQLAHTVTVSTIDRRAVLILPCFNEAKRLRIADIDSLALQCDMFFVDDGSTDDTASMLRTLVAKASTNRLICLPSNQGKGAAVQAGLRAALPFLGDGDLVGFADADFATAASEILRLRELLQRSLHCDVVIASRLKRLGAEIERNVVRHLAGRVFATAASFALGLPIYDTQCGAKWFRVNDKLRAAVAADFHSRWAFDVELLGRLHVAGATIIEEPLRQWRHVAGSKLRPFAAVRAGLDLFEIAANMRRTRR
jgi:dolichyl-phosphate beta-glucosyltransferase